MPPPRHRWLYPSKQDPWNAVFARHAAWVAALQWICLLMVVPFFPLYSLLWPVPPWKQCLYTGPCAVLFLFGCRGVISGYANRMGSVILAATNGAILLFHLGTLALRYADAVARGYISLPWS